MNLKTLLIVISLYAGLNANAQNSGGGDNLNGQSTKDEVKQALQLGNSHIKESLSRIAIRFDDSGPADPILGRFFKIILPAFESESLMILSEAHRPDPKWDGGFMKWKDMHGVCLDENGKAVGIFVYTAVRPNQVDLCISGAALEKLSQSDLDRQIAGLIAFGVATAHGYSNAEATNVQSYIVENY